MILIKSRDEVYDFLSKQYCSCSGLYQVIKYSVYKENETWIEEIEGKCTECNNVKSFHFDITTVFNETTDTLNLFNNWEIPLPGKDKLYQVKEKEYKKELEKIESDINEVMPNNLLQAAVDLLGDYYPKIGGRYQIFRYFKGGMGTTYLCVDTQWTPDSSRPYFVVCKTTELPESLDQKEDILCALQRESYMSIMLGRHIHILEVFDIIQFSPSRAYLLMEFIPPTYNNGSTLEEWIKTLKSIELPMAINFAQQLCKAMIYCGQVLPGFGHGDLKPENLFICIGKELKVGDFGLSSDSLNKGLKLGGNLGTPYYLAPEFDGNQLANEAGDVYSFGLILLEMLTGEHPFKHITDPEELRHAHQTVKIKSMDILESWISGLITRCISKTPNERPTFNEILKVLSESSIISNEEEAFNETLADINNRALKLIGIGKAKDGVILLKRIVEMEPDNFKAKQNLAYGLSRVGNFKEAEKLYQELSNSSEANEQLFINYAAHITRTGDKARAKEAILLCDKALSKDENNLLAMINKGAALNTAGDSFEAVKILEKAKTIDPRNVVLLYELSFGHFKLFESDKKEKTLEKSLRILNDLILLDAQFTPSYNLYLYIIKACPPKSKRLIKRFLNSFHNTDSPWIRYLNEQLE